LEVGLRKDLPPLPFVLSFLEVCYIATCFWGRAGAMVRCWSSADTIHMLFIHHTQVKSWEERYMAVSCTILTMMYQSGLRKIHSPLLKRPRNELGRVKERSGKFLKKRGLISPFLLAKTEVEEW